MSTLVGHMPYAFFERKPWQTRGVDFNGFIPGIANFPSPANMFHSKSLTQLRSPGFDEAFQKFCWMHISASSNTLNLRGCETSFFSFSLLHAHFLNDCIDMTIKTLTTFKYSSSLRRRPFCNFPILQTRAAPAWP